MAIFDRFFKKGLPSQNITTSHELARFIEAQRGTFNGTFDYSKNVAEGFLNNPIVYHCVSLIAYSIAQPRIELYLGDEEVTKKPSNPLVGPYNFINKPNQNQTIESFMRTAAIHYLLAGEFFAYMVDPAAFKRGNGSIILIDPDKVKIDKDGYLIDDKTRVPFKNADGTSSILHFANWHPYSNRGLSALQPAWLAINNYNEAARWNRDVLANSAKLSLVATIKSFGADKGTTLTQKQLDDLAEDLGRFATGKNKGKPFVGSGDMMFQELGQSNKELEMLAGMDSMAKAIAMALGVDPVLIDPNSSSYNNKKQANRALFSNTILPLLKEILQAFGDWFRPLAPGDWEFRPNLDDVQALSLDRTERWNSVDGKSVLTINERRALLGYGPVAGGDVIDGSTTMQGEPNPITEERENQETTGEQSEGEPEA